MLLVNQRVLDQMGRGYLWHTIGLVLLSSDTIGLVGYSFVDQTTVQ